MKLKTATLGDLKHTEYEALSSQDWFNRTWIIQEVAKARSARVVCGTMSVSARIFAVVPSSVGVKPRSLHQAVLDIMPGHSRTYSWWSQGQDLYTLLRMFQDSKATDPRDKVYSLLNIPSDAYNAETLIPDYNQTPDQVASVTVDHLLGLSVRPTSMLALGGSNHTAGMLEHSPKAS